MSNLSNKLDLWINNNYNILLIGEAGVGKTAQIIEAFDRNKLKWLYFSASTMDPWVDFIGVPKEQVDPNTGKSYLDLVRPKIFEDDEVEAIFFDEYNRAPKKVRNATMEMIQFKSINGKRFNNLRVIVTAINPADEEGTYDVEKLDPAQMDRFHVQYRLPYLPDAKYFAEKYGDKIGILVCKFWKELPPEQQKLVSPRRLDYITQAFVDGVDPRDICPKGIVLDKLLTQLEHGSYKEQLMKVFNNGDAAEAKKWISDPNNLSACQSLIMSKTEYRNFFLPLFPRETISLLFQKNKSVRTDIYANIDKYEDILEGILSTAKINAFIANEIKANIDAYKAKQSTATNQNPNLSEMTKKLLNYDLFVNESGMTDIDISMYANRVNNLQLTDLEVDLNKVSLPKKLQIFNLVVDNLGSGASKEILDKVQSIYINILNGTRVQNLCKGFGQLPNIIKFTCSELNKMNQFIDRFDFQDRLKLKTLLKAIGVDPTISTLKVSDTKLLKSLGIDFNAEDNSFENIDKLF